MLTIGSGQTHTAGGTSPLHCHISIFPLDSPRAPGSTTNSARQNVGTSWSGAARRGDANMQPSERVMSTFRQVPVALRRGEPTQH
jgi:hypothetical protein